MVPAARHLPLHLVMRALGPRGGQGIAGVLAGEGPRLLLDHAGPPKLHPDEHVEDRDEDHWGHEEQEGGDLERVREYHVLVHAHHTLRPVRLLNYPELDGLRDRECQGDYPDHED